MSATKDRMNPREIMEVSQEEAPKLTQLIADLIMAKAKRFTRKVATLAANMKNIT